MIEKLNSGWGHKNLGEGKKFDRQNYFFRLYYSSINVDYFCSNKGFDLEEEEDFWLMRFLKNLDRIPLKLRSRHEEILSVQEVVTQSI